MGCDDRLVCLLHTSQLSRVSCRHNVCVSNVLWLI